MQSGTRIFAPFIFSRMNDMKSWFFFARFEADHEWRDFEYVWGTCGGGAAAAGQRVGGSSPFRARWLAPSATAATERPRALSRRRRRAR